MAILSKIRKKVRKHRSRKDGDNVLSLPSDLLLEVIAKVASNSFDDLCRIRQSCKEFNKAGQDDYIFQHVSIEMFPLLPMKKRKRVTKFMKRCGQCGNAEALFRQGIIELFSEYHRQLESGFECLKKAADKGHREATYVYGVILACLGGKPMKKQGLQSLSSLNVMDLSLSREKIISSIRGMWVNSDLVELMLASTSRARTCSQCGKFQNNLPIQLGWEELYDQIDDLNRCDSCTINWEVNIFCDRLRNVFNIHVKYEP